MPRAKKLNNPLNRMLDQPLRDVSGAMAANRFSFQVDWAFCRLLDLHQEGSSYVVVMDLFDDVTIGNDAKTPTHIDHFQIKTDKSGDWNTTRLLQKKKGAQYSIIGKLYYNRAAFPSIPGELVFVSNASYDLPLRSGQSNNRTVIKFADLSAACSKTMLEQVQLEHGLPAVPALKDVLRFEVTPLGLTTHTTLARGKLAEVAAERDPTNTYPVNAVYLTLGDRLRRRNDEEGVPATLKELYARKSLTRDQVESVLAEATPDHLRTALWQTARHDLMIAGESIIQVRRYREFWNRYYVERMDSANHALVKLRKQIRKSIQGLDASGGVASIIDVIRAVRSALVAVPKPYSDLYAEAAILVEFYDEDGKISATHSQSSGEAV